MLGVYLQSSIVTVSFFSIIISVLWYFSEEVLIWLHQEPNVAKMAAIYVRYLIPGIFAYGFIQCTLRFLQTQSVVVPLVICSAVPLAVHVGLTHLLVHVIGLGFKGASLSASISLWISFLMLVLYIKFSVNLEYWAFEILVLLAALLPDSESSTSLIAMCVNTDLIAFMIAYGLSAAVSTRVSNEMGARNIEQAKKAVSATLKLAVLLALIFVLLLAFGHNIWAYCFSSNSEIVRKFAYMTPFLAASVVLDSAQGILSGVSRGCGLQYIAAWTNLVNFYIIGLPLVFLFGFKLGLYEKGLWMGLICGLFCQACTLLVIINRINWSRIEVQVVDKEDQQHFFQIHISFYMDSAPLLEFSAGESNEQGRRKEGWLWKLVDVEEVKYQLLFSIPMIITNMAYYAITLVSVMFAGHLGDTELAGATLGNSWSSVTGIALVTGLSGALETFCGQGFGAKLYRMLGVYLQSSIVTISFFSIIISVLWYFSEEVLIWLHQEPNVAKMAAIYVRYLIPGIFAYGFIQCTLRFLQTQSVVVPLVICSAVPLAVHVGLTHFLVHVIGLGFKGASLSASISLWISFLMLVLYIKFSVKFKETWQGLSKESFHYILPSMKLAIPSALMVCLEYWAFEILVLLAALLPDSESSTSLIAMCVNTEVIAFMITYGLSAAVRYINLSSFFFSFYIC
ncbi:hypothetical protein M5K25_002332 [Dendrobium thyrsiflorum]|uniref:Protein DETOXIFICATION n=1 Tax=Dendrobium thyrsiflorum TaxID=117978 RepID=A0ABD0W4B5_DENTH